MVEEEWRAAPGYEGAYEVSSLGRVRSLDRVINGRWGPHVRRGVVLRAHTDKDGYKKVRPSLNNEARSVPVHHLVLLAFIGPRPEGHVALHKDGRPENNAASNLSWGTYSDNALDAVSHGTHRQSRKTHCPTGHPYSEENTRIDGGSRRCVACKRKRDRARRVAAITARPSLKEAG